MIGLRFWGGGGSWEGTSTTTRYLRDICNYRNRGQARVLGKWVALGKCASEQSGLLDKHKEDSGEI